ncbi:MAG: hypothetical protein LCH66_04650 [Actinobacteria bacterium]|nr:hypothetical protein [Actinomycetota bacterium]
MSATSATSATGATGHRLTLIASARRYDLVVPDGTRVADVLSVLGIASSASPHAVATPSGRLLGPHDLLEDVPVGGVLTVVRMPTHALHRDVQNLDRSGGAAGARDAAASGGRARGRATPLEVDDSTRRRDRLVLEPASDTRPRPRLRSVASTAAAATDTGAPGERLLWAATGLAVVVTLSALMAGSDSPRVDLPLVEATLPTSALHAVAAMLLLAATVGLAAVRRAEQRLLSVVVAPALAFGAGFTLPLAQTPGRIAVSLVAACALAVLALALARVRRLDEERGDRAVMAVIGGLGLVCGVGTTQGWPGSAIAALVLGVSPLVVRALPTTSLTVDPTQLLDTERLATTIWSVRERSAGRRRRVVRHTVSEQFQGAREVVALGTAYAALAAVIAGWVLVTAPPRPAVPTWGAVALTGVAALAFAYPSRGVRDRLPRWSMLGAAAALLGACVHGVLRTGWTPAPALVVLGALVLGWVCVAASTLIVSGYRSTRLSRLADVVEGLAVALSLPLGIVAADGIEALRRLASG